MKKCSDILTNEQFLIFYIEKEKLNKKTKNEKEKCYSLHWKMSDYYLNTQNYPYLDAQQYHTTTVILSCWISKWRYELLPQKKGKWRDVAIDQPRKENQTRCVITKKNPKTTKPSIT